MSPTTGRPGQFGTNAGFASYYRYAAVQAPSVSNRALEPLLKDTSVPFWVRGRVPVFSLAVLQRYCDDFQRS